MDWCFKPSLSTLSNLPERLESRYLSVLTSSWPSEPGAYELTRHIGTGSSASVYQAHCKQLQRTVAVKKLDLDRHCDLAGLIREASLLRRFQHRHVLLLYTSFVVGRELWMVMPYMDRGSVRSIIKKSFPQGLDEVLIATIMRSTLQALHYVHTNGGIHRDIKADNILVNSRGEVRLADFGVASDIRSSTMSFILNRMLSNPAAAAANAGQTCSSRASSVSCSSNWPPEGGRVEEDSVAALRASLLALRANTFIGTPCFMAPEIQLEEGYNNAADIWSVGITLIELATGKPPLARCNPLRVLTDTLNCPPPSLPPDSSSRRYSKAFRDLVATCLQKNPSKRPSAAELLQHRFFKLAKDATYLSTALLPAQHSNPGTQAERAASMPAEREAVCGINTGVNTTSPAAAASRTVHSEPLMARLRSVLGGGSGLGSLLGPKASRLSVLGGAHSQSGGCSREKSRWQLTAAAAAGLGLRGAASLARAGAASAGPAHGGNMGGSVTAAAGAGGEAGSSAGAASAASAGSLSRSGSRGVKAPLPAAEAARYSWYAK